ncbi:hypothetical protein CH352_14490 [Leptospira hartskeerlii]|uniref:Uncharacterized protein n=1 Tax=Leptospira hartskeerlii TaxID=2023177 RepID=A0A2M9XD17_9LEPT|nr:hypothetical protein [Leptospira hartskeerlii]PJZ25472.1 hypothetical protein CH357_11195 [Leptospira hartskeerlii]PJZ32549.1 hypothetical protein CH352_14490 [Leptospira hartskeerlii]
MADDFTIDEGEGFPAGNGEDFDPSEMSLDEIDSLLASDGDSSDFNFDSVPGDSPDSEGFEELLASSGDDYPEDIPNFEPEETDFGSDLSQLDESVHLDEDFDFELTDPMIDAEIDRLLDIDDDLNSPPTSSSSAPSWKESSPTSSENHEEAFGDLGSLDLGDFSQPGEVPSSAFHSDDQPFDWGGDSSDQDEVVGLSDADLDDETPISLSDDELHNIDIGSNLADFSMDEEETSVPEESSAKTFEDEIVSDDEGPISLSEHELDDIMAEDFSPNMEEEGFGDLGGDDISMPSSELTEDINFEGEEEKDIALSTDELDHLLGGDGTSLENKNSFDEMGDFGDLDIGSVSEEHTSSDLDMEEEANEPIALSDDELGNLLSSGDEDEIESIQLDDLDSVGAPTAESEFGMEEGADSSELDLSDFNFDSEPAETKDEFGGEEESISLPVSDFDNFGIGEEENPLDTGLDLEDFEDNARSEEKAFEESLGDFTSASDEDILGSSDSDSLDFSPTETSEKDFFSETSDPDEPIALSDDELGNLLSSGTEEEAEHTGTSLDLSSDLDDNEPIALSDDELGNLLSGGEESVSSLDSEEDEPIALSDDELGDLLSSGEEESSDADIFADAPPLEHDDAAPVEFGDFSLDTEADEPIALSEDELGHLLEEEPEVETAASDLMEDSDEPISLPINELDDIGTPDVSSEYDIDWDGPVADLNDLGTGEESAVSAPSDWDLGEEADEPITLSNDELGNLLSDETPPEVDSEDLDSLLSSPPEANDLNALGSFEDDIQISGLDFEENIGGEIVPTIERLAPESELNFILDEYADEDELSPLEEIRQAGAAAEEPETGEPIPTQDEMKRILLYLDELLGNLPDEMIRDFSRSDYFELYKKLMKQIGV